MVGLAAFRTKSADLPNYYMEYKSLYKWSQDNIRYIGFSKFEYLFSVIFKMDFQNYLTVFYLFCFVVIIMCIKSLTQNVNPVLSCYLIYSYALDVVQMKTMIAETFAITGICLLLYYLKEKGTTYKNKNMIPIVSLLFILFAGMMHFSTVYFVVPWFFLLLHCKKKNISRKLFKYVVIAFIALYGGLLTFLLKFANQLGLVSDLSYLSIWTTKNTNMGWLLYTLVIMIMFIVCRLLPCKQDNNYYIKSYVETSVFLIPLLIMDVTYFRNIRISFIFFYSYIVNRRFSKEMSLKEFVGYILFILLMIYVFILDLYPVYDGTLGALLNNNSLLSF